MVQERTRCMSRSVPQVLMCMPAASAASAATLLFIPPGGEGGEESRAGANGAKNHTGASTAVKAWDPDMPYLKALKSTWAILSSKDVKTGLVMSTPDQVLSGVEDTYYKLKSDHGAAPSFFFDVSTWYLRQSRTATNSKEWNEAGVRILTNVFETRLDDPQMLRVAAYGLTQAGDLSLAVIPSLEISCPHCDRIQCRRFCRACCCNESCCMCMYVCGIID